ncbi:MAG TPA: Gfo/Idh/MocA family oxidoreductase [Chloroflexota bacterium]|nr:Gfo/Idh/MocA family oxidoreductase [Chloroflexota bacterium]
MPDRIKLAAVGCGGMGRRHLRGIAVLYASSQCNIELVAACDLKPEQANLYADEAEQLLGTRPRTFTDVAAMVREIPDLVAADVTVESGYHHTVAIACMEAGLHVMVEKPMGITIRACDLMVETAARTGKVLSVAENYRRDPIHRLAKALIDDGAIGTPRLMIQTSIGGRANISMTPWRHMKHTASMPVDGGVHEADLLRYYMGEFKTVYGESRLYEKVRYKTDSAGPGGFYGGYLATMPDTIEPTGDDALYAYITFENGASGQWIDDHAGHGLRKNERLVYGSAGSLQTFGNRNGKPSALHLDDGTVIDDARILEYAPSYRLNPLMAELFGGERLWTYSFTFNEVDSKIIASEYYELGECIRTGASPEVTGEEGRADVALTYAPFESGRLGRPVTLDDMIARRAYVYQGEIDEILGLVSAPPILA